MSRDMQVQDSIVIAAEPLALYEQVADPSQMGRWSPENRGAEVPIPGQPATVGTSFVGSNRRGRATWVTRCTVTAADPGVRFAFDVRQIGARQPRFRGRIASWSYDFEPVVGGTKVTETWTDNRRNWPDVAANVFDKTVTGGRTFADFQRRNIAKTLARLKTDFEGTAAQPRP
ncbi:MAG: SRPBCC family protein [Aeromicrobium sp.]|uniref:SRPBCC family protein n=1 Tax=Aeromicrobium sp. TaxID=1871063 RepID=UPI003C4DBC49